MKQFLTLLICIGLTAITLSCTKTKTYELSGTAFFAQKGTIFIGLATEKEFLNDSKIGTKLQISDSDVTAGKMSYQLKDIPAGRYAITAFQDTNGNGILDMKNQVPNEPFAIYHYYGGRPDFEEVSIAIDKNLENIDLKFGSL